MGWNFKKAQVKLKQNGIINESDIVLKGRHIRSIWWTFPGFVALSEERFIFVYTHMEDWAVIDKQDVKKFVVTHNGAKLILEFVWLARGGEKVKLKLKLGNNDS